MYFILHGQYNKWKEILHKSRSKWSPQKLICYFSVTTNSGTTSVIILYGNDWPRKKYKKNPVNYMQNINKEHSVNSQRTHKYNSFLCIVLSDINMMLQARLKIKQLFFL